MEQRKGGGVYKERAQAKQRSKKAQQPSLVFTPNLFDFINNVCAVLRFEPRLQDPYSSE